MIHNANGTSFPVVAGTLSIASQDTDISASVYRFEFLVIDEGRSRLAADQGPFVVEHRVTAIQS